MSPGYHATTPLPAPAPVPWMPSRTAPDPAAPGALRVGDGQAAGAHARRSLHGAVPRPKRASAGLQLLGWACLALFGAMAPVPPAAADTLVATRTIRPATPIGPADVALVAEVHPGALSDPADVLGMEARVALYPGRPIRPGDVGPAAVVERNGIVPLVFRRGGLTILAEGRALGRGAPGETVRVMNLSSRSTVSGVIGADGSVHVAGSTPRHP